MASATSVNEWVLSMTGVTSPARDPSFFVLGAYIDAMPVGLAWGLQMRSPATAHHYVHGLDMHGNWRQKGVGTVPITAAMTLARRAVV